MTKDVNRCSECHWAQYRMHYDGTEFCNHPEVNHDNPRWLAGGPGMSMLEARGGKTTTLPWPQRLFAKTELPRCGLEGRHFLPKDVTELCEAKPQGMGQHRITGAAPVMTAPYVAQMGSGVISSGDLLKTYQELQNTAMANTRGKL